MKFERLTTDCDFTETAMKSALQTLMEKGDQPRILACPATEIGTALRFAELFDFQVIGLPSQNLRYGWALAGNCWTIWSPGA